VGIELLARSVSEGYISGQSKGGLPEMLTAAGLTEAHVVEAEEGFCVLAIKP
jgi:hypothetical protein